MSRTVVITPPADLVTLAEAKTHLRVTTSTLDDQINLAIAAATASIDGPRGNWNRAFGAQTLEWRGPSFGSRIDLVGPVIEIVSVTYLDADLAEQTADADLYVLEGDSVTGAYGESWPTLGEHPAAVRVRYRAGVENTDSPPVSSPPDEVKMAALLQVEIVFRRPEGNALEALKDSRDALMMPHKVWTV